MISKCANPECSQPFHYLREGRLFQVTRDHAGRLLGGAFSISEGGPPHRMEHYWLCGACAQRYTLVIDPERGVVPASMPPAAAGPRRKAA